MQLFCNLSRNNCFLFLKRKMHDRYNKLTQYSCFKCINNSIFSALNLIDMYSYFNCKICLRATSSVFKTRLLVPSTFNGGVLRSKCFQRSAIYFTAGTAEKMAIGVSGY